MELIRYWKDIDPHPHHMLLQATQQYHNSVQFIAMVGKAYLPQKPDNLQTNMEWWPDKEAFAGWRIPADRSFRLVLETSDFRLAFYEDARHQRETVSLHGMTRQDIYEWLQHILQRRGNDPDLISYITQYEIPDHPINVGASFEIPPKSAQEILASYRKDAELILSHFAVRFPQAGSVRIWPHYFDTSCHIPLTSDNDGKTERFLSLGLAVPDTIVKDYYFYVQYFSETEQTNGAMLPQLNRADIWHTNDWKGATLPLSTLAELPTVAQQVEEVTRFFEEAISALVNQEGAPIV